MHYTTLGRTGLRGRGLLGRGLLWHGSSWGCEDLPGQPLPQPPGEVRVGIDWRDGLAQCREERGVKRIRHRESSSPS